MMDDTLICIPSRGRPNLSKSTLRHIPQKLLEQTILFVREDEYAKYKRAIFNCQFEQVRLVSTKSDNIAGKRHEIGMYAAHLKYNKFIMLDDDISQFSTRIKPYETPLRKSEFSDSQEMFETVSTYLDWYAHVGISQRFHNDAFVGDDPIVVENTRMLRFLAYQTTPFLECIHGRFSIMEDLDITLQLLQKGYKNAVLHRWCQDQSGTNSAGGCSTYRTLDLHNSTAQAFHETWNGLTRLREKANISPDAIKSGLANRLEVVISWKDAYAPKA